MTISSDAQQVINNAGAGAMDYINNSGASWGNKLTSGEAANILGGFDPANITADVSQPTDLMSIQSRINDKYGVGTAQTAVDDTNSQLRNVNINVDDEISMSKLVGQRGKATDALQNQLQGQVDVLSAAQNQANTEFGIAQDERNKIEQLMLTSPNAGITYADTFESAITKYNDDLKYQEEKALEAAEKAKKDGDYDQLFAMYGTTSSSRPKGMSKKEYLKALEKEYGDLAGGSSGFNERSNSWKPTTGSGKGESEYLKNVIDPTTGESVTMQINPDGSKQIVYPNGKPVEEDSGNGGNNGGGIYGAGNVIGSWFQSFGKNEMVYNRDTGKMESK